ncbi:MAG: TIGR03435 family protein [Bryobacteraceae bacterium]|jgi:uncharacterized protein (TIGR03435 family)
MIPRRFLLTTAALCLLATVYVFAQDKPARLAFEVTSIKASAPPMPGAVGGIKALPGGQEYSARGVPVDLMISLMYKIPMRQITGGPDWIHTDRWDVDAKADHSGYTIDDLHVMYQNMLADEFKLKFHKETKEGPVYALLIDKSGLRMKANRSPESFQIPINGGPDGFTGTAVPMPYLTWWLGQQLQQDGRPVINRTGLDGNYDFKLAFLPELPPNFNRETAPPNLPPGFFDRPNLFDALKQQLGLKLEPQKGPVEFYAIDHAEKPAAN